MSPDSSNTSLFSGFPEVPSTVASDKQTDLTKSTTTDISSILSSLKTNDIPSPAILTTEAPKVAEIIPALSENLPDQEEKKEVPTTPAQPEEDPRFARYIQEDSAYQNMLRTTKQEKIRLRLAVKYLILMFIIFLVVAWMVNNRIIMFGFSEFHWLARLRDGLFAFLAGLFSLTIRFGSDVWFRSGLTRTIFKFLSGVLFLSVLSALYFPLW